MAVVSNEGSKPGILGDLGVMAVQVQRPDDYKSDPAGNAGDRIACGVINRENAGR
jgi:Cu-Zn family superoxide dismutase